MSFRDQTLHIYNRKLSSVTEAGWFRCTFTVILEPEVTETGKPFLDLKGELRSPIYWFECAHTQLIGEVHQCALHRP